MEITQERLAGRGPKNKKQIGRIGKGDKIYIEDYAVTYLHQVARSPETKNGFAGLFGTCREVDGVKEYYIYSAVYQECEKVPEGGLPREVVQKIMRQRGELFAEHFFLGWALIFGENKGRMWESCYRSRMETLIGKPELLMTIKCQTCEEHFYLYPTEMPKEVEGYFVFYEQNDAMQNFLIDWHGEIHKDKCDEEGDNVAESCRNYYKEKKAKRFRTRLAGVALAAGVLLLLFSAVVSTQNLNGYDKIQEVGQAIEEVEANTNAVDSEELVPIQWEPVREAGQANEAEQILDEVEYNTEEMVPETEVDGGGQVQETENIILSEDTVAEEFNVVYETPPTEEVASVDSNPIGSAETKEVVPEENADEESVVEVETVVLAEEYVTYEVAQGDTLYGICVRFYGNLRHAQEICELNEIEDMDNILYGQKILLPR